MDNFDILKDRPDILKLIEEVALEQGLKNFKIRDLKQNQKGEGFLSQVFFVSLTDTSNDLNVIVKASFNDEKSKSSASIAKCGENEIYFYTKVYNTFKLFQKNKGVEDETKFIPKCYKTFLGSHQQLLCLENLRKANFETIDKREVLDHDHVCLIFKTYGKFHAFSYALRDQEPKKFHDISSGLYNLFEDFINDETTGFSHHLKESFKLANKYLILGEDDEIIEKFKKYLGEGIIDILAWITKENNDSFAITHGDCWSNNMMFKYEKTENSKKLLDLRLIDLQISKLGSPACDLSYCLYSGGSKKIFDNLNDYLKIYYESFSSFLIKLGSDPQKLFPFKMLEDHWKRYAKFGMAMAVLVLKTKLTDPEEIVDYSDGLETDELVEKFLNAKFDEKIYQRQIRELLHHMHEFDLL